MSLTFELSTMHQNAVLLPPSKDATADLLADWRRQYPDLGVLMLVPESLKDELPWLQSLCREQSVPLMGAIFPALLDDSGFLTDRIWCVRFDRRPQWFLLPGLEANPAEAGAKVAAAARELLAESGTRTSPPTLFMIFDAMVPNIGSLLFSVYGILKHAIVYAGVNAGSETFQPMPCLFDAERILAGGVLGILLPEASRVVAEHGYPTARSPMRATSTSGNRIDSIDGRPAFQVYQDVIRAEYGIALTHENFYDYAVHFPFGVVSALDVLVRIPVGFNEDGSLFCVGEVPPNSSLRLLRGPEPESRQCVDALAGGLNLMASRSASPDWLLTFYCAGRRMHFGAHAELELQRLSETAGGTKLVGALSLGEIDSATELGFPRFQNACMVCLPWTVSGH